jgi:hypothetical protein
MRNARRRVLHTFCAMIAVSASVVAIASPAPALTLGVVPSFHRSIEGYAPYQPQTTCARGATKGAVLLSRWLLARYRGSSSSGIMRACGSGGRSEHKDGRAFDWHVDHRTARGRAQGTAFLKLALGTDKYGNRDAIARRMGIMYIIWNDRIYSSSRGFAARPYVHPACSSASRCNATLRHVDHMHISLGWSGARAVTSFWDGTVAGVSSRPRVPVVVKPRVVTKPKPKPKPRPISPPVLDQARNPVVALAVSARTAGTRTRFSLRAGTTYRFVATGYYRFGAGNRLADAACSWHRLDDAQWARQAEGTTAATTRLKLTVNGAAGWVATRGGSCDDEAHAYVWDYRPRTTGPVTLRIDDQAALGDNAGSLSVRILRYGASTGAYRTVLPARAPEPAAVDTAMSGERMRATESVQVGVAGARTTAWLAEDRRYLVRVSGTWQAGDGVEADAECSKTPAGQWRLRRSADPLHPGADFFDLYIDGHDLQWEYGCSPTHEYAYLYEPDHDGNAQLALWDNSVGDDSGSVKVDITPWGRHG